MRSRYLLLWATLALILITVNGLILREELLRRTGERVLLELAPRDPRSLIQGDYMVLNYAIARPLQSNYGLTSGRIVLALDDRAVGSVVRFYENGDTLAPNEVTLRYRRTNDGISFGVEEFFFQEGDAERYARAAYAELRVDPRGRASLIGLMDANLQPINPP
ncbi:MAG: GDYXXLXY domain-containing protein [Aggregatilineales bacterium]